MTGVGGWSQCTPTFNEELFFFIQLFQLSGGVALRFRTSALVPHGETVSPVALEHVTFAAATYGVSHDHNHAAAESAHSAPPTRAMVDSSA